VLMLAPTLGNVTKLIRQILRRLGVISRHSHVI
jgi:hypothetical protein